MGSYESRAPVLHLHGKGTRGKRARGLLRHYDIMYTDTSFGTGFRALGEHYGQVPMAVVGMSCRLPGHSNSPQALWEFLERGGIADNTVPESRFRLDTHHDGSKKVKTMRSPGGMFLESVDPRKFDAAFFGIGKADAVAMDPQQRQLLEVVYECLENAGVPLAALDDRTVGCFVGSYAVDYADMQARDPNDRAPSVTIGVGRAILSNRISHFLNMHGPSMTIDTACSSSLVGLDVACRYLATGEIEAAIVAGANLYLSPEHNMDSGPMKGASSLSGRCHTFDAKADGYIKAEAINCVMLKRLSDALRDGDPIRAIIRGTSTNSDGKTAGIASPSAVAQASAIRAAYTNAGIGDADLAATGYVEMHGTGTQAGDPEEVRGVASVFASSRDAARPLVIGSIKSNIGHSEPAAGISGLIKAIMAVEKAKIPGNPTFVDPNPNIDFEGSRVMATRHTIDWPSDVLTADGLRRASVNSFGYGGSNAHVIVDQVPTGQQNYVSSISAGQGYDFLDEDGDDGDTSPPRPTLLVLSANDEKSVKEYADRLRRHLLNPRVKVDVKHLAYTLSERRSRHFHRGYVVAQRSSTLAQELGLGLGDGVVYGKKRQDQPRVGFVFTGQGAQWSQMGKALLHNFPQARAAVRRLDEVLAGLVVCPPTWSLMDELTQPRSPEHLRRPEFSQPLVTALQVAVLAVLVDTWNVRPEAVVGHSSGEIAAAYAAGLLSEADAIKAAYYRGYACAKASRTTPRGMMAVGLGPQDLDPYLTGTDVTVACHNSPDSVTLSGTEGALELVRERLVADQHFARMLRVDMAYHSPLVADAALEYAACLRAESFATKEKDKGNRVVAMFSSVEGEALTRPVHVSYWHDNMVQPVLFDAALSAMLQSSAPPDFLIEIGPSGALAGPVKQVIKHVNGAGTVQYASAMARGNHAERAMLDVAGSLFVAGHDGLDLCLVNAIGPESRLLVTDLPNYAWNRSSDYWYESEASRDWRFREFAHHDLLGSKVLGTAWQAPAWKNSLNVEDVPWLKHHRLGPDVVFPAAGYMCMAMEAMMQVDFMEANGHREDKTTSRRVLRLRNLSFDRALVLEEGNETRIMLTLAPHSMHGWYHWVVRSLVEGSWIDHCQGQVRIMALGDEACKTSGPPEPLLSTAVPGSVWYKSMSDVGYHFDKVFQRLRRVEATSGSRRCRAELDMTPPPSSPSRYPLHPAALDGCMQSCAPGLWRGIKSSVKAVLVPATIDDLVVVLNDGDAPKLGLASSESFFAGPGRTDLTVNYSSSTEVVHPSTGDLVMRISGLRYHSLDLDQDSPYAAHRYSRLAWEPDVTLRDSARLAMERFGGQGWDKVDYLLRLVGHKKPHAKVVEVSLVAGNSESAWLRASSSFSCDARKAFASYAFFSTDAAAVVTAQSKYHESPPRVTFSVLTPSDKAPVNAFQGADVGILRLPTGQKEDTLLATLLAKMGHVMAVDGQLLVLEHAASSSCRASTNASASTSAREAIRANENLHYTLHVDLSLSDLDDGSESSLVGAHLATPRRTRSADGETRAIDLVHLNLPSKVCVGVARALASHGWDVVDKSIHDLDKIRAGATIVVLSDLNGSVLGSLTPLQWEALQKVVQMRIRVVWVTQGAGACGRVTNPEGAMAHGLLRSVKTEDPSARITVLDVEDALNPAAARVLDSLLNKLVSSENAMEDREFVERDGIVHVSRILGDDVINAVATSETGPPKEHGMRLHQSPTTVRLVAERVGSIDSLRYVQVHDTEMPVPDNQVEVELFASALNFKDVAVTMGIVPENAHLLGLEGAGIIRRVGANLNSPLTVGQRVLVFEKGTFANRIVATTERTIAIPDCLSYQDAATLPSVYLTALFSLFNLSGLKKDDSVLIHSASGGLGIASMHVCHAVGATVYATVGQDSKRRFLTENFGIPPDRIFNSRTPDFEPAIMAHTEGRGVDIILNSLTGDLLDASWRCIAEGGTMVELGKKDHLARNVLAMEPFSRNASYRCFDMSHKHVSDQVIAVLMKKMMDLMACGAVKPISPVTTFSYADVASAMRFMRSANHIGKIIIANADADPDPEVPVRPAQPRKWPMLRPDVSYLIVGGLRGLCGSLAVDMARHGARHVVVMGRSGFDDPRSQVVLKDLAAERCKAHLVQGDVACLDHVRRAFKPGPDKPPVAGVVQGAMVLRDRPFELMTHDDYHAAVTCKLAGTWNLHRTSLDLGLDLDFFTLLSSISGLIGQPAQANYAAANAFLDSFAHFRRAMGLKANSVSLGAIDDVGYMAENSHLLANLDTSAWTPINERLFLQIVGLSIAQQQHPAGGINPDSNTLLITAIAVPQAPKSRLVRADPRFTALLFGATSTASSGPDDEADKDLQALKLMLGAANHNTADVVALAVDVANRQFMKTLRLDEPLEPAKPLAAYGLDSLAAVEFRNWARAALGAELSTLDVTAAPSLLSLADKIVGKMVVAGTAK